MSRALSIDEARRTLPQGVVIRHHSGVLIIDDTEASDDRQLLEMIELYRRVIQNIFWLSDYREDERTLPGGGLFRSTGIQFNSKRMFEYIPC